MQNAPHAADAPAYATLPLVYRLAVIGLDLGVLTLSVIFSDFRWMGSTPVPFLVFLAAYPLLVLGATAFLAAVLGDRIRTRLAQSVSPMVCKIVIFLVASFGIQDVISLAMSLAFLLMVWVMLVFATPPRIPRDHLTACRLPGEDSLRAFAAQFGVYDLELYSAGDALPAVGPALYRYGPPAQFLFDGRLLAHLTPGEQQAVFAHELAHHRLHHSVLSRWAQFVYGLVLLAAALAWFALTAKTVHTRFVGCTAAGPGLILLLIYFTAIALRPLYLWYMRLQERQANRMALRMTDDAAAFESAMVKVAEMMHRPPGWPSWWTQWFFATHPTLEQTIRQARAYGAGGRTS